MLDEGGCSFRIKCEQNSNSQSAWPTYTNSTFLPQSKIDGMTDEKIESILNNVFDLSKTYKTHTGKEITDIINKHFLCNDIVIEPTTELKSSPTIVENKPAVNRNTTKESAEVTDETIDKMLEELV